MVKEGYSTNREKQVKRLRKYMVCPGSWEKLSVAGLQLEVSMARPHQGLWAQRD